MIRTLVWGNTIDGLSEWQVPGEPKNCREPSSNSTLSANEFASAHDQSKSSPETALTTQLAVLYIALAIPFLGASWRNVFVYPLKTALKRINGASLLNADGARRSTTTSSTGGLSNHARRGTG